MKEVVHPTALERAQSSPLVAALRAELRALVEAPMTPQTLTSIERLLEAARGVLAALDPDFGRGPRRRRTGIASGLYSNPMYEGESEDPETFGARMTRELVSALSNLNKPQPPDALGVVQAIRYARENQMHDVAAKLEGQLSPPVLAQVQIKPKEAS